MKKCLQYRLEFAAEGRRISGNKTESVTLTTPAVIHQVYSSTGKCVSVCIERILKCQDACFYDIHKYDFPINPCFPVLPPGEYEISVPEQSHFVDGIENGYVDIIFEPIDNTYIDILTANKC